MARQRCSICGHEDWPEKLLFCSFDQLWLCPRCCTYAGIADPSPRCPRCFRTVRALGNLEVDAEPCS